MSTDHSGLGVAALINDSQDGGPGEEPRLQEFVRTQECAPGHGYKQAFMVMLPGQAIGTIGVAADTNVAYAILPNGEILAGYRTVKQAAKAIAANLDEARRRTLRPSRPVTA